MKKKSMSILSILLLSFLLFSCDGLNSSPNNLSLEDSIKALLLSKDKNYNFLEDQVYMEKMYQLVDNLIDRNIIKAKKFIFGNLDEDNIPEIIVFREREINNLNDTGYLEVYNFNGEIYTLLDRADMNYDNSNYDLQVGKISSDKNGIYLSNKASKGIGITYGFTLVDGKLKSILNGKKLNLISVDSINTIKDIDNDGILEFSIYTLDPESPEKEISDKDKLLIWYKWDGEDGANIVDMERIKLSDRENIVSNEYVLKTAKNFLKDYGLSFIKYLKENYNDLSADDLDNLLKKHLSNLNSDAPIKSSNLEGIYREFKIPLDKINDITYIGSEDTISLDEKIKKDILKNLNLGYKIVLLEEEYKYNINYEWFLKEFEDNISNEYKAFLKILVLDNFQVMNLEKLTQKISTMESFILIYPYSKSLEYVKTSLNKDMSDLLERISKNKISQNEIDSIKENYGHTYFYEKIEETINNFDI